jgi:hypothetical protein
MNKVINIIGIFIGLTMAYSCNNESRESSHKSEDVKPNIEHSESNLNWLIDLGINGMQNGQEKKIDIFADSDTLISQSVNIFQSLRFLNRNFQKEQEENNDPFENEFKLKRTRNGVLYIECSFGKSKNRYYLTPGFISDSILIMIPYERRDVKSGDIRINRLSSFLLFEASSKEALAITFNNFFNPGNRELSLNTLNTISLLNTNLYETYMSYFYENKQKFSVSVSYDSECKRKDKLYLPDTSYDKKQFHEYNDCRYSLMEYDNVSSIFMQRDKYCGMEILITEKPIIDKTPSWCINNKIY